MNFNNAVHETQYRIILGHKFNYNFIDVCCVQNGWLIFTMSGQVEYVTRGIVNRLLLTNPYNRLNSVMTEVDKYSAEQCVNINCT